METNSINKPPLKNISNSLISLQNHGLTRRDFLVRESPRCIMHWRRIDKQLTSTSCIDQRTPQWRAPMSQLFD